jgi:hypothetical protein
MRHQRILMILCFNLTFGVAFSQVCDGCDPQKRTNFLLDSLEALRYVDNYDKDYRFDDGRRERHSVSVEFSRESFESFYETNFKNSPGKYAGMTLHFVSSDLPLRAGQKHPEQFGVMLAPRGSDCRVDSNGLICGNSSFDGNLGSAPREVVKYTKDDLRAYQDKYEARFKKGFLTGRLYTTRVFLDVRVCEAMYDFFVKHPNAEGLAIYPGVYRSIEACGQQKKKQLTLILVPIVNGKPDFGAFNRYVKSNASKFVDFFAFNHGSLCPSKCY